MAENIITVLHRWITPYYVPILVVFFVILFSIVAYYGYQIYYTKPDKAKKDKDFSDVANMNRGENDVVIYFFYVDWCPHCKTTKPDWNRFKTDYDGRTVKDYVVRCMEINCTNETPEITNMINSYKIEGYPTVKMLKDNQQIEFDSKVSYVNLEAFVNTML